MNNLMCEWALLMNCMCCRGGSALSPSEKLRRKLVSSSVHQDLLQQTSLVAPALRDVDGVHTPEELERWKKEKHWVQVKPQSGCLCFKQEAIHTYTHAHRHSDDHLHLSPSEERQRDGEDDALLPSNSLRHRHNSNGDLLVQSNSSSDVHSSTMNDNSSTSIKQHYSPMEYDNRDFKLCCTCLADKSEASTHCMVRDCNLLSSLLCV